MKIPTISRDDLEEYYIRRKWTIRSIAAKFYVSEGCITYWLKKYNMTIRRSKLDHITKGYLLREYVENRRTMKEIALDNECTECAIWNRLRKYGIETRHGLNIDNNELEHLYNEEGMSLMDLAKRYNCSVTAIRMRLIGGNNN